MKKNLLIFATLFLALTAGAYAELRDPPAAPQPEDGNYWYWQP